MRDLHADWKRWTKFERASALAALSLLAASVPMLTATAFFVHQ